MADAEVAKRLISDIGKQLAAHKSCPNKDLLVKLLRQATSAFPELDQSASLKPAIKPLSDSLVKHNLLQHKDKDVRLLVAICFCEVIRVLAPNPDFSTSVFKDIFKLFLGLFAELADTKSAYFSRRLKVLEIVAKLKFCVLMFDTGCEDLVLKMFETFFTVVREHHPQSLFSSMSSIIALILKEGNVSHSHINVILQSLLKEGKGASPAASRLAVSVIQNCAEELETYVCEFLNSCIVNRDAVGSDLKEFYHEILFEVFQCAPQMLLVVIPTLSQELLADQVDVRIKAVKFIGRLLSLPGHHVAQEYRHLFIEFTKRFSDKSAEVRLGAISCAKAFYMTNPSGTESLEVLSALEGRLLDFDDRVRTQAVFVACDLARANLKSVPRELISRATERLRDKKVSVRKKALQKLLEVYRDYCTKCAGGIITPSDHFEQILCRILMLCYDKDCKDFRPQNMELLLAEEMFPASLSVEEKTRHWVLLFSLFDPPQLKALNSILYQKRRLQTEMQVYLALRREEENNGSEEVQKGIQTSVIKLSSSFPDSSKAAECFHKLNLVKDKNIYTTLAQLLDDVTINGAEATRDNFLRKMGDRHPHFEFLRLLSTKCLFNIFSSEHVNCILDHLLSEKFGNNNLEDSMLKLLLAIISAFPLLLRGSEKKFQLLLKDDKPCNEQLIQILAKAGPHVDFDLSDIYPSLERVCLEGTRAQSKLAVSAIAALTNTAEQYFFSELCETLVGALHGGQNIPTVLQSLGCMAQHSASVFESQDEEISRYIVEQVFQSSDVEKSNYKDSDEPSGYNVSRELKIFGLKALVRSFLPHRPTHVRRDIKQLLDVLSEMLQNGYAFDSIISCESDKANIRLAAAKSVLRLSRRWDLHFPPQVFRFTILMAKDSSALIRRLFIDKIHKLLKQHAVPGKYACGFAFAASDSPENLQDDSLKYMAEFIRENSRGTGNCQKQLGLTDCSAYIVVFLIHVLAHDCGFPPENCNDEEIYAQFLSPLVFTLQALVNASFVDGDMDVISAAVSCLQSIFFAIKRAEDAVDARITPKLHNLADFGIAFLNSLNHSAISATHTPGLILLPSSLYRISPADKREEGNLCCLAWRNFNAKIAKRVAPSSESKISQSSSTLVKPGRKCQEVFSQSDVKRFSTSNLASHKNNDLFSYRIRERSESSFGHGKEIHGALDEEINTRKKQKRAHSPSPPGSVKLHNEFSIDDEHEMGAFGNPEPLIGIEHLPSSCDSITTQPSLTQKGDLQRSSVIVNGVTNSDSIGAEPSKFTRLANLCSLKDVGPMNQALVGQRINLWSPVDKCYYSGTVSGFNSRNDTHKIIYDNGEVEVVSLETENWERVSNDFLQEKESNSFDSQQRDIVDSKTKMVDSFRDVVCPAKNFPSKGKRNCLKRSIALPADKK
ncbi:sister chromatid cohesion protein PDS5 homolog B-like isoform X3 [Actinidia eriantha]|uniref:sister chromatid cohesion protein PDS5 homolog B-like isoform X3 n=1 Tax=Actinidia eriantha TaxID=165200 RepID=UPI00258C7999|nr:sister chromatid cohesion protein PDS5 homolog B-like isoform X3 [Actinidia eriantha]